MSLFNGVNKRDNGVPALWSADQLRQWEVAANTPGTDTWYSCRPLGYQGICLRRRLKLAWGVFTGKYDAVRWEGGQ